MHSLRLIASSFAVLVSVSASNAAEVALPPFYQGLAAINADQPLGTVVAREQVATSIPGAEAWRIA